MGLFGGGNKKNESTTNNNVDNSQTSMSSTLSGSDNVTGSGNTINEINVDAVEVGAELLEQISNNQTDAVMLQSDNATDLGIEGLQTSTDQLEISAGAVINANDNMTDLAVEISAASIDASSDFVADATDLAVEAMAINADVIGQVTGVVDDAIATSEQTTGMSLDFAENVAEEAFLFGEKTALAGMDAALAGMDAAVSSNQAMLDLSLASNNNAMQLSALGMDNATDLAIELSQQSNSLIETNTNKALETSNAVVEKLNNGYASMAQFMESATRSDGSKVAQSTNKMTQTVFLSLTGLVAAGLLVIALKGKK